MRRDLTLYNLEFPDQDKLEEYWNKRYSSDFHTEVLGRISNRSDSLKSKCGKIYEINDEILKDIFGSHKNNNHACWRHKASRQSSRRKVRSGRTL